MLLMAAGGFGMMQGMAATNTVIQTLVPEDKRGRVMSDHTMAFTAMAPFWELADGRARALARHAGSGDDHQVQHVRWVGRWFMVQVAEDSPGDAADLC